MLQPKTTHKNFESGRWIAHESKQYLVTFYLLTLIKCNIIEAQVVISMARPNKYHAHL